MSIRLFLWKEGDKKSTPIESTDDITIEIIDKESGEIRIRGAVLATSIQLLTVSEDKDHNETTEGGK